MVVDYTTPSKRPIAALPDHACRCAVCLGEELQLGPLGARDREHDKDFCIVQEHASETSHGYSGTQDSQLLPQYCPSKVWAFSLAHRSWREVPVRDLQDVVYPNVSATKLYIKLGIQELFESLVNMHVRVNERAPSNGPRGPRGCNVLLQGSPGSGKSFILGTEAPVPALLNMCQVQSQGERSLM